MRWTWSVFFLAALASSAGASNGSIEMVWQPIWLADANGPIISAVTYLSDYYLIPGSSIQATIRPNTIPLDGKPENSNSASKYGLSLEVQEFEWNHVPDTMTVTLHVPADDDTTTEYWAEASKEVVPATAQCILFNALAIQPQPPRFINLKILGSKKWKYLDGVHSLKNVRVPSSPMGLSNGKLQE